MILSDKFGGFVIGKNADFEFTFWTCIFPELWFVRKKKPFAEISTVEYEANARTLPISIAK